jgi:PIN domain
MHTVLLDTNVVTNHRTFRTAQFQKLFGYRDMGAIEVPMLQLVRSELIGIRRRRLKQEFALIRKAQKVLASLDDAYTFDDVSVGGVEEGVARFQQLIDQAFRKVIVHGPETLAALIERAVSRRRPFNEQGHGFRDATLWETACQIATESEMPILLVSNDKVFGKGDRLDSELVEDLQRRRLGSDAVVLFYNIASLLEWCDDELDVHQILEELVEEFVSSVEGDLNSEMKVLVLAEQIEVASVFGIAEIEDVQVESTTMKNFFVKSGTLTAGLCAEVELDVEISTWDETHR